LWNKVAKGLERDYPDRFIGVMRYSAVSLPPVRERVHKNVILSYTGGSDLRKSLGYRAVAAELEQWFEMGLKNFYWRPNLLNKNCYGLPLFLADDVGRLVQYLVKNGCKGFDYDSWKNHFAAEGVNLFVIVSLMWDPEQDVGALIREYFEKAYGRAGKHVHEYFMVCKKVRERMVAGRPDDPGRAQDYLGALYRYYDLATLQEFERIATRIEEVTKSDAEQFERRTAVFLVGVKYALLQLRVMHLLNKKDKSIDDYNRLIEMVQEKERFIENLGPTWAVSTPVLRAQIRSSRPVPPGKLAPYVGYQFYKTCTGKTVIAVLPDEWSFYIDQSESGERKGLPTEDFKDSRLRKLSVHDVWENQGFDYNGVAWYRTRFAAPKREPDKRHTLWFGAIDGSSWVYVNGALVGERDSSKVPNAWFMPYAVDVTDHLRPVADNLIVVRVHDKAGLGGIYRGALLLEHQK